MHHNLTSLSTQARAIAHAPNCYNISECPLKHNPCRRRLNLKTSIAWEIANVCQLLASLIEYYSPESSVQTTLDFVNGYISALETLSSVLSRHERANKQLLAIAEEAFKIAEHFKMEVLYK